MTLNPEYDAEEKIARAAREGTTLHIVGFSGGADSQACAWWVRQRYPAHQILLMNSDAGGNEHPLTTAFVAHYSQEVFPVLTVHAEVRDLGTRGTKPGRSRDRRHEFAEDAPLTFDRLAYIKNRFPSRKAQFCTEHLKLAPQRRWIAEHITPYGISIERYVGLRCDESAPRAATPASCWDTYFHCQVHYPIRCWTKTEVFQVLRTAHEPLNPLYTLGFNRVGCAPCINSSKQDIRTWAARFPAMIDKVRDWETQVGRTFFPPCVPGLAMNWVDEVVAWANTGHGGRQGLLLFQAPACESSYGLCE